MNVQFGSTVYQFSRRVLGSTAQADAAALNSKLGFIPTLLRLLPTRSFTPNERKQATYFTVLDSQPSGGESQAGFTVSHQDRGDFLDITSRTGQDRQTITIIVDPIVLRGRPLDLADSHYVSNYPGLESTVTEETSEKLVEALLDHLGLDMTSWPGRAEIDRETFEPNSIAETKHLLNQQLRVQPLSSGSHP